MLRHLPLLLETQTGSVCGRMAVRRQWVLQQTLVYLFLFSDCLWPWLQLTHELKST